MIPVNGLNLENMLGILQKTHEVTELLRTFPILFHNAGRFLYIEPRTLVLVPCPTRRRIFAGGMFDCALRARARSFRCAGVCPRSSVLRWSRALC